MFLQIVKKVFNVIVSLGRHCEIRPAIKTEGEQNVIVDVVEVVVGLQFKVVFFVSLRYKCRAQVNGNTFGAHGKHNTIEMKYVV